MTISAQDLDKAASILKKYNELLKAIRGRPKAGPLAHQKHPLESEYLSFGILGHIVSLETDTFYTTLAAQAAVYREQLLDYGVTLDPKEVEEARQKRAAMESADEFFVENLLGLSETTAIEKVFLTQKVQKNSKDGEDND